MVLFHSWRKNASKTSVSKHAKKPSLWRFFYTYSPWSLLDSSDIIEQLFRQANNVVTLFIGNINFKASEAELRQHLDTAAVPIQAIRMLAHEHNGLFKGVAYVDVDSMKEAEQLIEKLNAKLFTNRSLRISIAKKG